MCIRDRPNLCRFVKMVMMPCCCLEQKKYIYSEHAGSKVQNNVRTDTKLHCLTQTIKYSRHSRTRYNVRKTFSYSFTVRNKTRTHRASVSNTKYAYKTYASRVQNE